MGIRKNYGKNKKTGRHELMAEAQHADRVRKARKPRPRRARRGR